MTPLPVKVAFLLIVPVPVRVPVVVTLTGVEASEPSTSKVPALMFVAPV